MIGEVERLEITSTAKDDLLFTIEEFFPSSVRDKQLKVFGGEDPLLFLKGYIAAEVRDLCDPRSREDANVKRVAASLERRASMLNELARHICRRSEDHR